MDFHQQQLCVNVLLQESKHLCCVVLFSLFFLIQFHFYKKKYNHYSLMHKLFDYLIMYSFWSHFILMSNSGY